MKPVKQVAEELEADPQSVMEHYRQTPGDFCRDILRMEPLPWQEEWMNAVSKARYGLPNHPDGSCRMRFAIKSGTGVGKTGGIAGLILWHLACFPDSKIPCTAPTSPQLKAVLWPELRKWVLNIPITLKEYFPYEVQTDTVKFMENMAVARTARDEAPESFQGFHSKNILLVADEASGVPDAIFLAGQGVMSSKGAITILIGNPTRPAGWFYDAFNGDSHLYWTKTVTCMDSKLVTKAYVNDMAAKHGEESYEFRVRVLGEFHLEDSGFIIPRSWVQDSVTREVEVDSNYIIWGIDVSAGGRDKSALAKRMGNTLLEPVKTWGGKNVMQFVGIIVEEYYNELPDKRPQEMCIDVIGVGQGFVARLKEELSEEIKARVVRVRGINVAERKSVNERYVSLRVELWAKARAWFEMQACRIPYDEEFINQICGVEWEIADSNGKWQIPDKTVGGRSPDKADAFVLTFAGKKGQPLLVSNRNKRFQIAKRDDTMYGIGSASYLER